MSAFGSPSGRGRCIACLQVLRLCFDRQLLGGNVSDAVGFLLERQSIGDLVEIESRTVVRVGLRRRVEMRAVAHHGLRESVRSVVQQILVHFAQVYCMVEVRMECLGGCVISIGPDLLGAGTEPADGDLGSFFGEELNVLDNDLAGVLGNTCGPDLLTDWVRSFSSSSRAELSTRRLVSRKLRAV